MRLALFTCVILLYTIVGKTQAPLSILPTPSIKEFRNANPDSIFVQWKNRLHEYEQNNDQRGVAVCLQNMAQALFHLGNFSASIERFLKADKIFRDLNDEPLVARNLNMIGTVYYYNQQPAIAYSQFTEALSIYKRLDEADGLAATYSHIGHYFEKQKHYDSALHYANVALRYAASAKDKSIVAKIYENIGSVHEDEGKYDSARIYFQRSLDVNSELGNSVNQIEVYNNLGDLHRKKGEYVKGVEYAKKAMNLSVAMHEKYQLQSAYRDIALNFNLMKQNDSAYRYLLLSRELVQELYSTENSKQITLLQSLHGTERKNAEIARLNAIRKSNTIFNIAVSAGAILLVLLGALIISKQKQKIKNQKQLMESEMRLKQLEEDSLKRQLEVKGKELSSHILHLIEKNETMEELKAGLTEISKDEKRDQKKQVRQLLQKISFSISQDSYWNDFRLIFDQVHQSFFTNLNTNYPELTPAEVKLLSLLKMNLPSNDISTLLGVAPDSLRVMRYRIKKKINLQENESLTSFIHSL